MIEIFKTSVSDGYYAKLLLRKIHARFPQCIANFDLTDCDRILRVQNAGDLNANDIISVVRGFGYEAEILPDQIFHH